MNRGVLMWMGVIAVAGASAFACDVVERPALRAPAQRAVAKALPSGTYNVQSVQYDDRAGLTFPVALKAFLRQDPDIIMVGEIRDLETAEIAIKAAQTGHMVLSTLHTNDAPQTLTRLMNMGVPTFNIASSILLITAQRLARRLCNCKKPISVPNQALLDAGYKEEELDGSWTLYGPGGCERCKGSGYKGRVGIYQVMPVSEAMQRLIMSGANALDLTVQAK